MRLAVAAALVAATLPCVAEARQPVRLTTKQAGAALQNPLVQEAAARTLAQLVGIVLDTQAGPAERLVTSDAQVRLDDTLRDVARRDDPRFEEHFYRKTRRALATAGLVAGGAAAQANEAKRTADRLDAALTPLLEAISGSN